MGLENCRQVSGLKRSLSTMGIRVRWKGAILYTHYNDVVGGGYTWTTMIWREGTIHGLQ